MAIQFLEKVFSEAIREVQRQRLKELEEEALKRERFLEAITKLRSPQRRILKWLWKETQRLEAYLEAHDLESMNLQQKIKRPAPG